MNVVDLSHTLSGDMPVYPGTEQPSFHTVCSLEEDGFLEQKMTMYSHTGTHVDAPAHLLKNGKTLEQLGIEQFCGPALLLNFESSNAKTIEISSLLAHEKEIKNVDFLLIHTGWSAHWGKEKYFSDYSTLSVEAAQWLSKLQLKGIGLDTISADVADTEDYPVHKIFLGQDIVIVENLTNLLLLSDAHVNFSCFPMKIKDADGCPVRAVATYL